MNNKIILDRKQNNKALFVLAHQDDELFISSRILYHLNNKDDVYIIWVTKSFPIHSELCNRRIAEALKFTKKIGINQWNISFLNYPDGYLGEHILSLYKELENKMY